MDQGPSQNNAETVQQKEHRAAKAFNIGAAWFAVAMLGAFLVMPFAYSEREFVLWKSIMHVLSWLAFSASWMYIGYLIEKVGGGFGFVYNANYSPRKLATPKEILFFMLVFVPLAYLYIYVAYLNTGYIGFNFIILFIVAGFATHMFPLWLTGIFLLFEIFCWNLLGYFIWGNWARLDASIQGLSGFAFSVMMFELFKRERQSRHTAVKISYELDEVNDKLRERSAQVEELASTRERNRIAREIHDTLGHSLTVVNMQLETARALLSEDPKKAAVFLDKAQSVTKQGLSDIRDSVASLRSSPLDGKTLEVALKELLEATRVSGLVADFKREGSVRALPERVESALYRSAQEGLTNVRKHAKAKKVDLVLDYSKPDEVKMSLSDDGVGCEKANGGFGLMGIRERIQLLNGTTEVNTSPRNGLVLSVSVPL